MALERRYSLEIFSVAGEREAFVAPDDILGGSVSRELNGDWTLDFDLDLCASIVSLIEEAKRVKLLDNFPAVQTVTTFVVRSYGRVRNSDGSLVFNVQCEHHGNWRLTGHIVQGRYSPNQITPEDALDIILDGSDLTVGTVTPTTPVNLEINNTRAIELVRKVAADAGCDWQVNEDGSVDLVTLGSAKPHLIKYGKNELAVKKTVDGNSLATRLYPFGAGDPPIDMRDHRLNVTLVDPVTSTVWLSNALGYQDWTVSADDTYVGKWLRLWDAEFEAATVEPLGTFEIVDSHKGNGAGDEPYFILDGDLTGLDARQCQVVESETGPGINYVENATAIAAKGTIEDTFICDDIPAICNLVNCPALDGPYSSGFCQDWYKVEILSGDCTPTENLSPAYIKQGMKSQKCTTIADGAGIGCKIWYTEGKSGKAAVDYLSVRVWVYVAAGSVRVELWRQVVLDPAEDWRYVWPPIAKKAVTDGSVGWKELLLEGIEPLSADDVKQVRLHIIQDGATNAMFYVDSAVVEPQASSTEGFIGGRRIADTSVDTRWAPTELMRLASLELPNRIIGAAKYEVALADLEGQYPGMYSADAFDVGDTVGMEDEGLGIDVQVRVILKTPDICEPIKCTIEVTSKAWRETDIIAQHELDYQALDRRLRKEIGILKKAIEAEPVLPGYVIRGGMDTQVVESRWHTHRLAEQHPMWIVENFSVTGVPGSPQTVDWDSLEDANGVLLPSGMVKPRVVPVSRDTAGGDNTFHISSVGAESFAISHNQPSGTEVCDLLIVDYGNTGEV